ncbi:MAG: metal-dependent hydrolase [Anaerolineae bacterium]|nr:metal-dependent hydrolase [Anaerolineae bacterium]
MQIPGHLAVAVAQSNLPFFRPKSRRLLLLVLLASLFPDIVDKTIGYVFHAMPNGRHFAHNIFSLIGLSVLVGLVWGDAAGRAWFSGYLGHLLADTRRRVPWFFPLKKYPFKKGRLKFDPAQLLGETVILLLVLILSRKSDFFHKRD